MKGKILTVVVGLCIAAMMNSCALRITSSTTRTIAPLEEPLMADIEVKPEKITGTYTERKRADEKRIKQNAVFNALANGTKGDLLVAPQYEIVKDTRFKGAKVKSITVTVTGYPAFYKNFRPVPKVTEYEVREVTPQTPFVVIAKDSDGNPTNCQVVDPVYPQLGIGVESVESVRINQNAPHNESSSSQSNKGKKK